MAINVENIDSSSEQCSWSPSISTDGWENELQSKIEKV